MTSRVSMTNNLPIRLIVCVDGTWCGPDGAHGNRDHNITNVYRFYISIKKGDCVDGSGKRFHQIKKYYSGIAAEESLGTGERLFAGILGGPCIKQIRDVYEFICKSSGPNDEIWLYGFSRGAYVIRTVAGLLHYIRAISSAGEDRFMEDFKLALKVYKKLQQQNNLGEGQKHLMFEASTRPAATIQFVGVFDTVKAVQDEGLYDISFNSSIQHMRHALALNEDRRRFEPEYIYPNFNTRAHRLEKRTFVQAWFVGGHIDIGGSADKDGLSLYPLQWMLIESKNHGLNLEFDGDFGGRCTLASPLEITGLEGNDGAWECTTKNGLVIQMRDITYIHEDKESKGRYSVHLHISQSSLWIRRYREPFGENGQLNGYYNFGAQGTIIHPSVYLVLDKFMHTSWGTKEIPFYPFLRQWRSNTLGQKDDLRAGCYWNDPGSYLPEESGAIRVLVCGNCGVGKSSLINTVLGTKATPVSHRTRGIHQIDEEITWKDRPDLVVHDSVGLEMGDQDELSNVQNFLKKRSAQTDFKERLHVIWYCFDVNDTRLVRESHTKLFKSFSEHAENVPLVAIATKTDEFISEMLMKVRRDLPQCHGPALDLYVKKELEARLCVFEEELSASGHFDDLVAISIHDGTSIGNLSSVTSQLITNKRTWATIIIYKRILISSSAIGAIPRAMTMNRTAAAIDVRQCNVLTGGMPFFLILMAINAPLVVLATTRLILMLAYDVILILTRAFREASVKSIAKPEKRDVEKAAVEYRKHCREVHRRVKKALPHVARYYQTGRIESLLIKIIEHFKCKVLEGIGAPLPPNFRHNYLSKAISSEISDSSSHSEDDYSDSGSFKEGSGI